jgi:hypothetical protein
VATNDAQTANGTTKSSAEGKGQSKAVRDRDADTRNFIETHDVTKVARKAVPGSGEEAADLLQDEPDGGSNAKDDKS